MVLIVDAESSSTPTIVPLSETPKNIYPPIVFKNATTVSNSDCVNSSDFIGLMIF